MRSCPACVFTFFDKLTIEWFWFLGSGTRWAASSRQSITSCLAKSASSICRCIQDGLLDKITRKAKRRKEIEIKAQMEVVKACRISLKLSYFIMFSAYYYLHILGYFLKPGNLRAIHAVCVFCGFNISSGEYFIFLTKSHNSKQSLPFCSQQVLCTIFTLPSNSLTNGYIYIYIYIRALGKSAWYNIIISVYTHQFTSPT